MIDFERKALRFGYGDISVSVDTINKTLIFRQVNPENKNIGDTIDLVESDYTDSREIVILDNISIQEKIGDFLVLKAELAHVNEKYNRFSLNGVLFDFENYNEKSVKVVADALKAALNDLQVVLAA